MEWEWLEPKFHVILGGTTQKSNDYGRGTFTWEAESLGGSSTPPTPTYNDESTGGRGHYSALALGDADTQDSVLLRAVVVGDEGGAISAVPLL